MAYDRTDAREQARNALASRLAAVREQLGSREALRAEEERLRWELEGLERAEASTRGPVQLPDGATLSIASPCSEKWDHMVGDEQVRHCSKCDKNVYNLSGMTAREIEGFLANRGEKPCVRFFKRKDGTMLTADCPVGRPKKLALRVVTALGVALGASAAGLAFSERPASPCQLQGQLQGPDMVMGEMAYEPPPPSQNRNNNVPPEPPPEHIEVAGGIGAYEPPPR